MSDKSNSTSQVTKILGPVAAILALVGLLLWGTNQSQTEEAQVITDAEKPARAAYASDATELEYEAARLGDYERGTKLVFDANVVNVIEDSELGATSALVNFVTEQQAGAETIKQEQVILVFPEDRTLEENADVTVQGRYIGDGEYETPLGGTKQVPAIQVDYVGSAG